MSTHEVPLSVWGRVGKVLHDNKFIIVVELALVVGLGYLIETLDLLPSSTVVLVLLGWVSLRLRKVGWSGVGLRRPISWTRTLLIGMSTGMLMTLLIDVIADPLIAQLTGTAVDWSAFGDLDGNITALLFVLVMSWTLAAFGEELSYRGYMLNRVTNLFGDSTASYMIGLVCTSVLFGLAHTGQGPTGVISSTLAGIGYGIVYLATGRNLWVAILTHGFSNTFTALLAFVGFFNA